MLGRIPRLVLVTPVVAALAVLLTASRPAALGGAETPALRSITSRLDGAVSTVLIEASEPVAYLTSQPDPLTVLVDLRNVNAGSLDGKPIMAMLAPVSAVAVESASAPDGAPVSRIRVRLDRAAKHRVRSSRNTILVEVDRAANATAAPAAAAARSIAPVPPESRRSSPEVVRAKADEPRRSAPEAPRAKAEARVAATELRTVKAAKVDDGFAITLSGNGALVATTVEDARDLPPRVLLDFHGVAAGKAPSVTNVQADDVERVRVGTNSRSPLITRVVIDLARKIPYTVEQIGDDLRVFFKRAVDAAAAVVTSVAPAAEPTAVVNEIPVTPEALPVAAPVAAAPPVAAPPVMTATVPAAPTPETGLGVRASAPAPMSAAVALTQTPQTTTPQTTPPNPLLQNARTPDGQRQFVGDPVTLDFQGADLRAVLRTFAEISGGLNIVIDPTIQGTVDVALHDVPWDQALDIILRANKLGYSVDGTIVRIVPLNVLATENEEQRKLQEAQALAGELRTLTVPVSYAKAMDLVPVITRSTLSQRGDVQVDGRTNTLIIRDLADRLTAAADLVRVLDRPQPQVEIEARIVQLNRNKDRDLGISWDLTGRVDPALGTSTSLAFPNNGTLTAGTGSVNPAANSAIGIVLGSINGAINLNVQLSALEQEGQLRVLSTPRVTTQNNISAEITQGAQIPIQVVANNTVTVQFKDAALTLRVTPQITAANTVIMNIFLENATPDYSETSPAQPIPAINTQRAVTTVLMEDGETTVIGGIYDRLESYSTTRTPFLHRIPLMGWLFKTESRQDNNRELLIFITPRIAR